MNLLDRPGRPEDIALSVTESVDGADFVNISVRTFLRDITHESRKDVGERLEYR